MPIYRGVGGVNREIKKQFRGVSGANREIKEQWRGVSGVNRKVFSNAAGVYVPEGYGSDLTYDVDASPVWFQASNKVGTCFFRSTEMVGVITSGNVVTIDYSFTNTYYARAMLSFGYYPPLDMGVSLVDTGNSSASVSRTQVTKTLGHIPVDDGEISVGFGLTINSAQDDTLPRGTFYIYGLTVNGVQII